MVRYFISVFLVIFLTFFSLPAFCQTNQSETITFTTYYPSPFGVYRQLQTQTLGVGDTNYDYVVDSNDVPPATSPGDVWIAGHVGIGTNNPIRGLTVVGRQLPTDPVTGLSCDGAIGLYPEGPNDSAGVVFAQSKADMENCITNRDVASIGIGNRKGHFGRDGVPGDLKITTRKGYDLHFVTRQPGPPGPTPAPTAMIVKNNGNVGIGNLDPQAKLHVDGNIRGQLQCRVVQGPWRKAGSTAHCASDEYVISGGGSCRISAKQHGFLHASFPDGLSGWTADCYSYNWGSDIDVKAYAICCKKN